MFSVCITLLCCMSYVCYSCIALAVSSVGSSCVAESTVCNSCGAVSIQTVCYSCIACQLCVAAVLHVICVQQLYLYCNVNCV